MEGLKKCVVADCEKIQSSCKYKGGRRPLNKYCAMHAGRMQRYRSTDFYGIKPGRRLEWKGRGWTDMGGYICTVFYGARFYVHRLVWALTYGPIPEGYEVHHINENKRDNRIENLQLMTAEEHSQLHKGRIAA